MPQDDEAQQPTTDRDVKPENVPWEPPGFVRRPVRMGDYAAARRRRMR